MSELARFLDLAWELLAAGVADADHPMRLVALATVDAEGRPQARCVVLRAADRTAAQLDLHTDSATAKVAELARNPEAALLAWSEPDRLQIRANGRVAIETGAAVRPLWDAVPPGSRVSYGTRPAPGSPIAGPYAYDKPADPERFAVLRLTVDRLDLVHLPERHRRARFDRSDGFAGTWLAP